MKNIRSIVSPLLEEAKQTFEKTNWEQKEIYSNWLAQSYYYVCHSTRLLAVTASRFGVDKDQYHTQLTQHIHEERFHERIAIADLKTLGKSVSEFPELTSTKSLYRSAYYLVERVHPVCFYGYVFYLELLPQLGGKNVIEIAQKCFGKSTTKFIEVHVNEDPKHVETYFDLLETMPHEEKRLVLEGFFSTHDNYQMMMKEIQSLKQRKALFAA